MLDGHLTPSDSCALQTPANPPCVQTYGIQKHAELLGMTVTDNLVHFGIANRNNERGSDGQGFHAGREDGSAFGRNKEPALTESFRSGLPCSCSISGAKSLRLMPSSSNRPSTLESFFALPLPLLDGSVATSVLGPATCWIVDTTFRASSSPNGLPSVEMDALSSCSRACLLIYCMVFAKRLGPSTRCSGDSVKIAGAVRSSNCVSVDLVAGDDAGDSSLYFSGESTGAECVGGSTDAAFPSAGGGGEPRKLRRS